MRNKLFSIFLILAQSILLFGAEPIQKKVEPHLEQIIRELLEQECIDEQLEIYDAGLDFHSYAAISFNFSGNGMELCMLINQEEFSKLSLQEQQSVILHEIGHIKRGAYRGLLCAFGPYLAGIIATSVILLRNTSDSKLIKFAIAIGAGSIAKLISQIAFSSWARHEEFAADAYAFNVHRDINGMCSLFEKRKATFDKYDYSEWSRFFEDHPTSQERINHIQLLARTNK